MYKTRFNDFGCCEIISEMQEMVEELSTRPIKEFDLIDLRRLVKTQERIAQLADKLFPELISYTRGFGK